MGELEFSDEREIAIRGMKLDEDWTSVLEICSFKMALGKGTCLPHVQVHQDTLENRMVSGFRTHNKLVNSFDIQSEQRELSSPVSLNMAHGYGRRKTRTENWGTKVKMMSFVISWLLIMPNTR